MKSDQKKAKNELLPIVYAAICITGLVVAVWVVLVVVPFVNGFTASNSVKTADIDRAIKEIHLPQHGTVTSDSKTHLSNSELGHQLTRNVTVTFTKPMSAIDVGNMLVRDGAAQVRGNLIWVKSYNRDQVFIEPETVEKNPATNDKYNNTMWSGLDPNVKYTHYAFTFSTS